MISSTTLPLKLGIIGLNTGNGHPYSWSAIFNGYNVMKMNCCPFPVIPEYLAKQTFPEDCIPDAKVTHVWTQARDLSESVTVSSNIDYVVDNYIDMIGQVDAILLARDDAENHLMMSIPFLEAGLPIYIDKPIATSQKMLNEILSYEKYPGQIFSCSALRFAREFNISKDALDQLGVIQYVEATIGKDWDKYAVHIIEPVLNLLNLSTVIDDIKVINLNDKRVVMVQWPDILVKFSTMGSITVPISIRIYGANGVLELIFKDTFFAFKKSLETFVEGVRTKKMMISHGEMRDIVKIIEYGMI